MVRVEIAQLGSQYSIVIYQSRQYEVLTKDLFNLRHTNSRMFADIQRRKLV